MRLKPLLAMVAVGLGAVLATGGPDQVIETGHLVLVNAGFVLLALAATSLLATIVPRGALAGPLGLAVAGLAVLAFQQGYWSADLVWPMTGGALVVAGGWLVMSPTESDRNRLDPLRREVVAFFPRRVRIKRDEETPRQLSIVVVGTWASVTFTEGCVPVHGTLELLVSCWAGRVEVVAPDSWLVVAGRVTAARGIRFAGELDYHRPFADPGAPGQAAKLRELITEHNVQHPPPDPEIPPAILVVHVVGLGGEASILRGRS